jgi:hypothetical protein
MKQNPFRPSRLWALVLVAVLAVVVFGVWARRPACRPRGGPPGLDEWNVPQLIAHLRQRGLQLRAVGVSASGEMENSAVLTTTDKDWREFLPLAKTREAIDLWQGTVSCERVNQSGSRDLQISLWGDCCLVVGPFLFFGDRDLLRRIRMALR